MLRKLVGILSLIVLAGVLSGVSYANPIPVQITFGPSTAGSVTFNNTGSPGASVAFSGISGLAYLGNASGNFTLSNASVAFASGSNSFYTLAANSLTLTVTIGTDSVAGALSLDNVAAGNTVAPLFLGSFTPSSSTPLFVNAGYAAGVTIDADFTVYTGGNRTTVKPTVDQVWLGTSPTTSGYVSSGEIIPDPVPEPGTIALMGTGLLGLAGFLRRRA